MAKRVKAYRKSLKKTQLELSYEIGISTEELSLLEREEANPSLETMQKIAAHMGITVADLLKVEEMLTEIYDLLYRLGVTANYTGFFHTAYAVKLCIEQPERLLLVTKRLYPEVAKRYGINWKAVERNNVFGKKKSVQKGTKKESANVKKIRKKER